MHRGRRPRSLVRSLAFRCPISEKMRMRPTRMRTVAWLQCWTGLCFLAWLQMATVEVAARPPMSLRIGSVFLETGSNNAAMEAFRLSVTSVNDNSNVLNSTRVDIDMQYAKPDPFDAYLKACREMAYSVMAVFGSSSRQVDSSVGSVCSTLHIPYLTTTSASLEQDGRPQDRFVVRVGPLVAQKVMAVADLVKRLQWKEVAVVVHRTSSTLDSASLIEQLQAAGITVNLLELLRDDIRPDLVRLRNRGMQRFVVDVGSNLLQPFFDQALKSGIVHSQAAFILSDLDFISVRLNGLSLTGADFWGFSLVRKHKIETRVKAGTISQKLGSLLLESHHAALLYDAVHLFSKAVEVLSNNTDMVTPKVKCEDEEAPFELGEQFRETLLRVSLDGVTARHDLSLSATLADEGGPLQRQAVHLDIRKLQPQTGLRRKVGEWSWRKEAASFLPTTSIRLDLDEQELGKREKEMEMLKRRHLIVQAYEGQTMLKQNDRGDHEGFLMDLLGQLSKDLAFDFTLRMSTEKGHLDKASGNWSGLLGELVQGQADFGLTDLTITSERSEAVDFTPPFDTSELTVLIQRPSPNAKATSAPQTSSSSAHSALSPATYLAPFSFEMWVSLLVALLLTSVVLFLVSRISPYERRARAKRNAQGGQFQQKITFCNTLWYTLAGFFLRSNPVQPKAFSVRLLTGFWWFFSLVIMVLYLLSLSRILFVTIDDGVGAGQSAAAHQPNGLGAAPGDLTLNQLIQDEEVTFGAIKNLATWDLIMNSSDSLHSSLRSRLDPSLDIRRMSQGALAVLDNPKLGFIVESRQADQLIQEHGGRCQNGRLTTVGQLGRRFYGLPFPKGSPYFQPVSRQILKYTEDGTLRDLLDRWFGHEGEEDCGGAQVVPTARLTSGRGRGGTLGRREQVTTFDGPFLPLLLVALAALAIAILEMLFFVLTKKRKGSSHAHTHDHAHQSTRSLFKEELADIFRCSPASPTKSPSSASHHAPSSPYSNGDMAVTSQPLSASATPSPHRHPIVTNNGRSRPGYVPTTPTDTPYKKNGDTYFNQTQALLRRDVANGGGRNENENSQL